MEYEISCVNINPLSNENNNDKSFICAVGMWEDITVR